MALELARLDEKSVEDLHELAKELSVEDHEKLRKPDLVMRIMSAQAEQNGLAWTQGVLEILPEGYGFLRVRRIRELPKLEPRAGAVPGLKPEPRAGVIPGLKRATWGELKALYN